MFFFVKTGTFNVHPQCNPNSPWLCFTRRANLTIHVIQSNPSKMTGDTSQLSYRGDEGGDHINCNNFITLVLWYKRSVYQWLDTNIDHAADLLATHARRTELLLLLTIFRMVGWRSRYNHMSSWLYFKWLYCIIIKSFLKRITTSSEMTDRQMCGRFIC